MLKLTQVQTGSNFVVELESWIDLSTISRIIKPDKGIGCAIVFTSGESAQYKEDVTYVVRAKEDYDTKTP
jgi:hypothetical protein